MGKKPSLGCGLSKSEDMGGETMSEKNADKQKNKELTEGEGRPGNTQSC